MQKLSLASGTSAAQNSMNVSSVATSTSDTERDDSSVVERVGDRYALSCSVTIYVLNDDMKVRDEHRADYDPGRGGWGAQAQRLEIERRREVEERYADAQDGPGAVAGGGEDWNAANNANANEQTLKRGRSPDEDEDEDGRVSSLLTCPRLILISGCYVGNSSKNGRRRVGSCCT